MESPAAAATATRSRTAFLSVPGLALSPRPLFSTFDFFTFLLLYHFIAVSEGSGCGVVWGAVLAQDAWLPNRKQPGNYYKWLAVCLCLSPCHAPDAHIRGADTRGFAACPPCCCLNIFLEIFLCFSRLLRQEFHLFYALSFLASCLHILCRYFSATLKGALVDQVIVSCRYTQSGQTRNTEWKRTERNRDVGHFPRFQFSLNTPIRTATSAGI